MPRRCLYDNAKVITLGRDEEKRPIWNQRMLDFARRVGFEARLCQPYRAQTKGKVLAARCRIRTYSTSARGERGQVRAA